MDQTVDDVELLRQAMTVMEARQAEQRRLLQAWLDARTAASADVPYGRDPVEAQVEDAMVGQSEFYLDDPHGPDPEAA